MSEVSGLACMQGEVEDIATKPPKKASDNEKDRDGFLELFEEIFGSDVSVSQEAVCLSVFLSVCLSVAKK